MGLEYKKCKQCGCLYEDGDIEHAFRRVFARNSSQKYLRSICIVCEQKKRDATKAARRYRKKARSCITTHYRKYKRLYGFDGTRQDFIDRYGWDLNTMERDVVKAAEKAKCPDCSHPYRILPDDITLDIREPDEPPIYGKNTEWICVTCNWAKGVMTMIQWRAKQRIFQLQEEFLKRLNRNPLAGLPLFDWAFEQEDE